MFSDSVRDGNEFIFIRQIGFVRNETMKLKTRSKSDLARRDPVVPWVSTRNRIRLDLRHFLKSETKKKNNIYFFFFHLWLSGYFKMKVLYVVVKSSRKKWT